ncbi:unnamed protein product [Cladocopium goreaui]|uniref:Uncharacterized protein n=1 Tax=Cladocopium goreaui TaxID=2562237 RepID=A0A9P1CLR8_9DINO|nr:unnamed protein product [Cladocopium goreaui]
MSRALAAEPDEPPASMEVAPAASQEERLEQLETSHAKLQGLVKRLQQELHDLQKDRMCLPSSVPEKAESELLEKAFPVSNPAKLEVRNEAPSPSPALTERTRTSGRVVRYDEVDSKAREEYAFQGSTWDLALFVGTDAIGTFGAIHTFILVLATFAIQVVFVGVVMLNFSAPRVDKESVADASRWRLATGHFHEFYDSITQASLTARVCGNDRALHVATGQASLYQTVATYLGSNDNLVLFKGPVLGMVAVTLWFLMVSDDVTTTLDLGRVLITIPVGQTCLVLDTEDEEDPKYRLTHISFSRKLWGCIITVVRLTIACVLLWYGTLYVVHTINLSDLVLNCIALEIVLNVDDLLFQALAPTPARFLMNTLQPIQLKSMPRRKGVDVKAFLMLLAVPIALILVYQLLMAPMLEDIEAVSHTLCGGERDFVWLEDSRRMVVMATSRSYQPADQAVRLAAEENAAAIVVNDVVQRNPEGSSLGIWKEDVRTMMAWGKYDFQEVLAAFKPGCQDTDAEDPAWFYMQKIAGPPFKNCSTVKPFCHSVSLETSWVPDEGRGIMARMLCPMTCTCWSEISPRLITTGCPSSCTQQLADGDGFTVEHRNNEFAAASCVDTPVAQLKRNPSFQNWIEQLALYANITGDSRMTEIVEDMAENGCALEGNWSSFACHFDNTALGSAARPFGGYAFFCGKLCCDSGNPGPDLGMRGNWDPGNMGPWVAYFQTNLSCSSTESAYGGRWLKHPVFFGYDARAHTHIHMNYEYK